MFLKLFIPTWNFFDQLGTVSKIYYRVVEDSSGAGGWLPLFEKPKRTWLHLFHNPHGNLYLAYTALIDRLVFDIGGAKHSLSEAEVERLESYLLVQNMVRVILRTRGLDKNSFQFKIQVHSENAAPEDFVISKDLVI